MVDEFVLKDKLLIEKKKIMNLKFMNYCTYI